MSGSTRKPPSGWWYAAAALIAFGGIALFAVLAVGAARGSVADMDRFGAPGQMVVTLSRGEHGLSYEHHSILDGKPVTGPTDAKGLACQIASVETGEPAEMRAPTITKTYSMGGYAGTTLHRFEAEQAGEYLLTCDYPHPGVVVPVAVGEGFTVSSIFFALVGGSLSFVIGVILFWVAFVLRRSRK